MRALTVEFDLPVHGPTTSRSSLDPFLLSDVIKLGNFEGHLPINIGLGINPTWRKDHARFQEDLGGYRILYKEKCPDPLKFGDVIYDLHYSQRFLNSTYAEFYCLVDASLGKAGCDALFLKRLREQFIPVVKTPEEYQVYLRFVNFFAFQAFDLLLEEGFNIYDLTF